MKKTPTPTPRAAKLQRDPRPLLRAALIVAAYLFVFIILDIITLNFEELPGVVSWYPPAGLTYALLLVFGVRFAPAVTIAFFLSSLFIYRMPQPPYALLLWAFIISLFYSAAAAFLRHRIRFDWQLRKLRDVTWFVLTAVFVSALLAVLSVSSSALGSEMPRSEVFRAIFHWWIGETVGVLTVTPFLLIHVMPWLKRFAEGQPLKLPAGRSFPRPSLSAIGQASSLALTLYWVFGVRVLDEFHPLFLIALPLIWIALQRGFKGVSAAILALNSGVVLALWIFRFDLARLGELQLLMIVICIVGLIMGAVVTDRMQADAALQDNRMQLEGIFNSTMDAIVTIDEEQKIVIFNPAAEQIFGCPASEAIGQTLGRFLPEYVRNEHREHLRAFSQTNLTQRSMKTPPLALTCLRADGEAFPSEVSISQLELGGRKLYTAIVRDVTERKRAEDDLRRNLDRARQTRNAMLSTLEDQKRAEEEIRRRADEFVALYDTARDLAEQQDLPTLLQAIVDRAATLLVAPGGGMYLYDKTRGDLRVAVSKGVLLPVGTCVQLGEGMAGRVAQTLQPLIVNNYRTWEGRSPQYEGMPFGATAEVPMILGGELIGVLVVFEMDEAVRVFTDADTRLLSLFAGHAASTVRNARLHEETVRQLDRMEALHRIDLAIGASTDLHLTLNILLNQVAAQLHVDAASILLLDPHTQTLTYDAGNGFRTESLQRTRLRLGEGYAGRAALERKLIYIPDLRGRKTDFLRSPHFSAEGFVAYYAVPLIAKGKVKGVLEVFHRAPLVAGVDWVSFLETLAGQAAIAIDNATLFNSLQRSNTDLALAYDATIEGWSHALDLRDKETEGHSQRVTEITLRLAKAMSIGDAELVNMRRGALLHDIGKMGVPDKILLKPGKLTDEEWVAMRKHPTFAFELLSPIAYLRPALDIPYCHHEKWDGTGYPRGLKGEAIPLAARIFAIVDVWDALRSDRLYRKAWDEGKVREHIQSLAGTHLDPNVVPIFLELMEKTLHDAQQR